jgi:hypothetical protein
MNYDCRGNPCVWSDWELRAARRRVFWVSFAVGFGCAAIGSLTAAVSIYVRTN